MNILTPNGYIDIKSAKVGDEVLAYDMNTGERIVNTIVGFENVTTGNPTFNEETKKVTYDIPKFYLINDTWNLNEFQSIWANDNVTHVSKLKIGDILYDDNDQDIIITSIVENSDDSEWIKFVIENDHSYIVDGLTLHNASRYWVGGNGDWWSASHWSAISGGAGGATVPGNADTAYADFNSGSATITTASRGYDFAVGGINFTGFRGTFAHNYGLIVFTSLIFSPTMTFLQTPIYPPTISIIGETATTILSCGIVLPSIVSYYGHTFLQDDLTCKSLVAWGLFTTNSYSLTTEQLYLQSPNIDFGSSLVTLTGVGTVLKTSLQGDYASEEYYDYNSSIVAGSYTIKVTDTSSAEKIIDLRQYNAYGSPVYNQIINKLWFSTGNSTNNITILKSLTSAYTVQIDELKDDGAGAHSINFSAGEIYKVGTWNVNGNTGNLITITSTGTWYLQHTSATTTNADYLNIKNSNASVGTWNALSNCVDGGGNSGWNGFIVAPSFNAKFFAFF